MPVATAAPTPSSTKAEKIGLLCHFAKLDDPRQSAKVMYPLVEIVFLVVCATIADCDDNVAICEWGRHHLDFLRRFLRFPDEIPSHDALGDVLNAIDPELFEQCFMDWIGGLRDGDPDILAIDGKTSRRTHDRAKGRTPLPLVSAWATRLRLVLGQQAMAEKSNEITAIPLLLDRLMLKGSTVTIDAMGTLSRDRRDEDRQGGRRLPGAEGEPARAPCRGRALLRRPASRRRDALRRRQEGSRPARNPPSQRVLRH